MKKTISINLAGLVYQIDDDAYQLLEQYLEKLKSTFTDPNEQKEILGDIEHRFAELFSEKLGKRTEVVNEAMVREAIETLGDIELIEEETNANASTSTAASSRVDRKLFRSTDDKVIAGVLGGLGAYFGIEPIWLRLVFVILAIASVGVPVGIIYIILWLVMPKAVTASQKLQMQGAPVNLNNIQENIKKNLSSENLGEVGSRAADGFGEILKTAVKIFLIIAGVMAGLHLLGFSFAWFFASFFGNFIASEYLALVFDSNLQFILLSISVYVLIALPLILGIYWLIKALRKQPISWMKNAVISGVIWVLALVLTAIVGFTIASNYKVKSEAQNYVDLPLADDVQELKLELVNDLAMEDFNFTYNQGSVKSGGFELSNKDIKINTIFLNIEASEDENYSLMVDKSARGKNKEDADKHLEKFFYEVEVKNGNTLSLPMTLTLLNENKYRVQNMSYLLKIPVGAKVIFPNNAHHYIDDVVLRGAYKQKSMDNNTWLMTNAGLECLTCPPVELDEKEDLDQDDIEELIEDYIEKEIEEAFE